MQQRYSCCKFFRLLQRFCILRGAEFQILISICTAIAQKNTLPKFRTVRGFHAVVIWPLTFLLLAILTKHGTRKPLKRLQHDAICGFCGTFVNVNMACATSAFMLTHASVLDSVCTLTYIKISTINYFELIINNNILLVINNYVDHAWTKLKEANEWQTTNNIIA